MKQLLSSFTVLATILFSNTSFAQVSSVKYTSVEGSVKSRPGDAFDIKYDLFDTYKISSDRKTINLVMTGSTTYFYKDSRGTITQPFGDYSSTFDNYWNKTPQSNPNFLTTSECAKWGGVLENVTVPAGTFMACKTINDNTTYWLGPIEPQGYYKSVERHEYYEQTVELVEVNQ